MNEPPDLRPMQTANKLRLMVLIPVLVAVVGVVLIASKWAARFKDVPEPPGRDYPPVPPPTAGQPGQPLRPVATRRSERGRPNAVTNATAALPLSNPSAGTGTETGLPVAGRTELFGPAPLPGKPTVNGGTRSFTGLNPGGMMGRVFLRGTPPPEKEIPMDPACGALHRGPRPQTRFFVVGANGGLADVFVVLTRAAAWEAWEPPAVPVEIRQRGCEYLPYVTAAQVGQVIRVFNDDPVMHNVHPTPTLDGNKEQNKAQLPKGAPLDFSFPAAEVFLRFKCDVHPWMFTYVSVVEHPFFAVTDEAGNFALPEPPPGEYAVRFIHRRAGTKLVPVKYPGGRPPELTVTFELSDRDVSAPAAPPP